MNLNQRLKEIDIRMTDIRKLTESANLEELTKLESEVDLLNEERTMISKKLELTKKFSPIVVNDKRVSLVNEELLEKRGSDLKEKRTIVVASEEILLPEFVSSKLSPIPFPVVSKLADSLNVVNLNGGESYRKPYVKDYGEAGNTSEGETYNTTEPTVDYVDINRSKITCLTEITEEVEKLPSINYQAEVLKNINISIKKKLVQQVLHGTGGANQFTGIFSSNVKCLTDAPFLEISEIDKDTLTKIIFNYGGDEEVEGKACLILNINDLYKFATLRDNEDRKVYDVNTTAHTIDGVPYIISSHCPVLSSPETANGTYCIAYGSLQNYELAIFSGIDIQKSTENRFKEGIVVYRASLFAGGNVTGYKGFLRVQKAPVQEV
jgi:hypothetical protein